MADVYRVQGKPREIVKSVQDKIDAWQAKGIEANPITVIMRPKGDVAVILTPFDKDAAVAECFFQYSNNPQNFVRGRLFNNTGIKIALCDLNGVEHFFGTAGEKKPLLPEIESEGE